MDITTSPRFIDRTAGQAKARFQFTVSGTEQSGTVYVTSTLSADRAADIAKAAKIVGKRAGASAATIHAVGV